MREKETIKEEINLTRKERQNKWNEYVQYTNISFMYVIWFFFLHDILNVSICTLSPTKIIISQSFQKNKWSQLLTKNDKITKLQIQIPIILQFHKTIHWFYNTHSVCLFGFTMFFSLFHSFHRLQRTAKNLLSYSCNQSVTYCLFTVVINIYFAKRHVLAGNYFCNQNRWLLFEPFS